VCSRRKKCYVWRAGNDVATAETSTPDLSSFAYAPGDVIAGKYALEEILGEGGMGAVFRARNTAIDMPVAIKLIRADLNRELLSGRLLQEARAAAKLTHPAIVRVFDVGQTANGDPFIVMELLEGESLSTIIEREGRLTAIRAVQLLLPIADALAAAHAKGFVHRDVKPDNVFVVQDEGTLQPKLVDFGIVKLVQREVDHRLTQVGAVLGSPDYMSPEQARGLEHVDQRSDVWSFAIMLYEAIAGVTPFESTNYNALLRMIVEEEAPPLKDRGLADEVLSTIVALGLRKDPAERFSSLGAMGKALAAWLVDQGIAEDICGVSLESKWLTRQTDPHGVGRSSNPPMPEGWVEHLSGIRTIGRSFGNAPTIAASKAAGTPASVTPLAEKKPLDKRWLAAGALLVVTLVTAMWISSARSARHGVEQAPATAAPPANVTAEEARPALPPTSVAIASEPSTAASAAAPVATPPVPAGNTARSSKSAASSAKPRPATPSASDDKAARVPTGPSTDLIAPY
jgi:eukaryotic-like serine/threonine-protein kinase